MSNELKVNIDGFSDVIDELLKEYGDEVQKVVEKNLKKVEIDTKKRLKETSPSGNIKRKVKYKDSWASKTLKGRLGNTKIIYNRQGQLTHLLERGHFKYNQHGGPYGGRTKAQSHIEPAQKWAEKELIDGITKDLE